MAKNEYIEHIVAWLLNQDSDYEREKIGKAQIGHEKEKCIDLTSPESSLHVVGSEEHKNAGREVSAVAYAWQREPEGMLQESCDRVGERVSHHNWCKTNGSSNHEDRSLKS